MQNVANCGEGVDLSSSEDGYASASLDGAGSQGEGGSANGGRAWDVSGVPVDYTFKVTPCIHPTKGAHPDWRCKGPPLCRSLRSAVEIGPQSATLLGKGNASKDLV